MSDVLTADEQRAILDGLEDLAGEFRIPVVIVDRVRAPGCCEVYEHEDVARKLEGDERLLKMLAPAQYPFVRVLVLDHGTSTSLRLARVRPGPVVGSA